MVTPRLVFLVRRPAGGLGDRYVGLVTAIQLARALGRDLSIEWEDGDLRRIVDYPEAIGIEGGIHLDARDYQAREAKRWSTWDIAAKLKHKDMILLRCNMALGQYLWRNPHYCDRLDEYDPICDYREAFRCVMLNGPALRDGIRRILARGVTWGIQVRMGEAYMPGVSGQYRVIDPDRLMTMLTQARELIPPDDKIFLTSDSPLALEAALKILRDYKVTYLNKPITHIDKATPNPDGLFKTFVDMHVLSWLPNLIITKASNFGRVPAIVGNANLWGWTGSKIEPLERRELLSKGEIL